MWLVSLHEWLLFLLAVWTNKCLAANVGKSVTSLEPGTIKLLNTKRITEDRLWPPKVYRIEEASLV